MTRALWIKAGIIANIVEYPGALPETEDGYTVVPAVTGAEGIGQTFDTTLALQDRSVSQADKLIVSELFRLTNLVRTLNSQATLTVAQYKAFLKTQA